MSDKRFNPYDLNDVLKQKKNTETYTTISIAELNRLNKKIAELQSALASEREKHQWIPVSEKPKDNQVVIGYAWVSLNIVITRYCERENAFYEYWRGGRITITHWQPLPEPPEREE